MLIRNSCFLPHGLLRFGMRAALFAMALWFTSEYYHMKNKNAMYSVMTMAQDEVSELSPIFTKATSLSIQDEIGFFQRNVDCCKDVATCRQMYPLSPLYRRRNEKRCPEKYILVPSFGSFNQFIHSLVSSLVFASFLDRTVVLTDHNHNLYLNAIDVDHVCIDYWDRSKVAHETQAINNLRAIHWEKSTIPTVTSIFSTENRSKFGFNNNTAIDTIRLVLSENTSPTAFCAIQSFPQIQYDKIVLISSFHATINPETYKRFLQPIHLHRDVASLGDDIVLSLFQDQDFIGIDLRNIDGFCPNTNLNSCKIWETIISSIQKTNFVFDPDSIPIYILENDQYPDIMNRLLLHKNVFSSRRFSNRHLKKGENMTPDALDTYILTQSTVFLGSSMSLLSFHVALVRELNGFQEETNVILPNNQK